MANLSSTIEIKAELRPCLVTYPRMDGSVPALWHCWSHEAEVLAPSLMRGGHTGGQIAGTLALVEYRDGSMDKVTPGQITFLDTAGKFEDYDWSMKE